MSAEQTGGYRTARLGDDKAVGGVMKLMQEGQPPAWMNYVCVEDADATAAKAREAGGQVFAEPMSVLDYGRMAVLADPTGAVFGWSSEEKEYERGAYTIITVDGEGIGGISDRIPAEVPANWLIYFAAEDADATIETARQRGGEIPVGPFDIAEVGRIAVVKDPWGAFFAVIQPDPAQQPS